MSRDFGRDFQGIEYDNSLQKYAGNTFKYIAKEVEEEEDPIKLKENDDEDIIGPWPKVLKAYRELTKKPGVECDECENDMIEGDRTFICPSCNKQYQVGTRNHRIVCFRDDVREGYVENVKVPDKYMFGYNPINEMGNDKSNVIVGGAQIPNVSKSVRHLSNHMEEMNKTFRQAGRQRR